MARFNLDDYETVESRLARFWAAHPQGRILTELVAYNDRQFIVKAEVYFDREDARPVATGFAEEIVGSSPVNKTAALENCETSAAGRALANCGFASQGKRPSREEMAKVQRREAPAEPTKEQLEQAELFIHAVGNSTSIDVLKTVWGEQKAILDVAVNGVTLRDAIVARKAELEAEVADNG